MRFVRLLLPPDPGGLRLLAALRATLAGVVTFFLVMLLGSVTALPVTDRILGFAIALFIAANVRDGTPRARLITIALAPLFAFAATTLAALLFEQPLVAAILLPLIMFAVAYGAPRGPRWASLGIVTLIAYFIGLVTHDPPATLPMRFVVLLIAAGVAALIRCVLLPERPRAELDRLHHAIHAGVVRVLDNIAAAVAAGSWTDPAREQLHEDVYRLDEVVMLAQARAAALAAELPGQENPWIHLLAIELGIERVARVALLDLGTPADRRPAAGRAGGTSARRRTGSTAVHGEACRRAGSARPRDARDSRRRSGAGGRTTAGERSAGSAFGGADRGCHRPGDRGG